MRIYELAKELGVENKIVLTKAAELGMSEKTSHSNSLKPDEADRLRRAIIRQAVGAPSTQEIVTKRVDRTTGATESLVERRVGNVIRRRRRSDQEDGDTDGDSNETAGEGSPPQALGEQDPAQSQSSDSESGSNGNSALAAANMLFESAPSSSVQESSAAEEVVSEHAVSDSAPTSMEASVSAAPPEVKGEESVTTARGATPGPRVLGKMDLPQRKVAKPEPRRGPSNGAAPAVVVLDDAEEEERGGKGASRKKGKKREFSRGDLIDYDGREMRRPSKSSRGGKHKGHDDNKISQTEITVPKASKRVVKMDEFISVGDLARQLSMKAGDIIAKLMELGILVTINQSVDQDTAGIIAEEFGYLIESTGFDEAEAIKEAIVDSPENLKPRPPVVTVMGHVDHGKTSLLDAIRSSSVASKEHGGITQHIGAYSVELQDGRRVAFIDTPGHAAFTTMRARGAQVTDIVILVVAADDGVMPQTLEAVNHAKAANVPIVVAVNKIDKPDSKADRIKTQLADHGLSPEEWGGETMYYNVSALKKQGIQELLEGILLLADVKELRANPDRRARGTIIESKQDRGRGTVATVLIQTGTLHVGEVFVTGPHAGKIRSMIDSNGNPIMEAGPSTPVEITGLSGMPEAGDDFFVVENESVAREVSSQRLEKRLAEERSLASGPISLEEFSRRANSLAAAELSVILKADVAGSVEAVRDALENLSTPKVKVKVLHAAVGGVNESDVQLAIASRAIIVGFGVRAEPRAMTEAEKASIEIRFYKVIYEVLDDIRLAMVGLLDPVKTEVSLGRVEVRNTFTVSKIGTIAGCYVSDGMVRRSANVRILRDNRLIFEGKMSSLKRFKDDAREVQAGFECGIGIERFNDVKVGDVLEVYDIQESAPTLD